MKRYISIDGGTSTTRISLVCDGSVTDTVKLSYGARSNISAVARFDASGIL